MANATVAYAIDAKVPQGNKKQKTIEYFGKLTFSAVGDTYRTGGMPATTGKGLLTLGPYANRTPISFRAWSTASSGFQYNFNTTSNNLQILAGGGNGVAAVIELTDNTALNATTPAISTDTVEFCAEFPMGTV